MTRFPKCLLWVPARGRGASVGPGAPGYRGAPKKKWSMVCISEKQWLVYHQSLVRVLLISLWSESEVNSSPFGPRKLIVWFEMQLVSTPSLHPRLIKQQWTRIQWQRLHLETNIQNIRRGKWFYCPFPVETMGAYRSMDRIGKPIGQETVM